MLATLYSNRQLTSRQPDNRQRWRGWKTLPQLCVTGPAVEVRPAILYGSRCKKGPVPDASRTWICSLHERQNCMLWRPLQRWAFDRAHEAACSAGKVYMNKAKRHLSPAFRSLTDFSSSFQSGYALSFLVECVRRWSRPSNWWPCFGVFAAASEDTCTKPTDSVCACLVLGVPRSEWLADR